MEFSIQILEKKDNFRTRNSDDLNIY